MLPSEPNSPNPGKNWFDSQAPAPFKSNRRFSVRYARDDIDISVKRNGLLNMAFGAQSRLISAQLIDISSKGALIATDTQLKVNKKLLLTLRFVDLVEFKVNSTIVRKVGLKQNFYGIKFDRADNQLADHLLVTQKKLTFT